MVTATFRRDASNFNAGFVGGFGGVFIFHPAIGRVIFNDLRFFDTFEFFDETLVSNFFHLVGFLIENIFLLETGHKVTEEVVENESAREVDHDEEHHNRHHIGHLASHNLVKLGLVRFFAIGGFFHDLTESFGLLRLFRGELLTRNPELRKGRTEREEEHDEGADRSKARLRVEVDEAEKFRVEIIGFLGDSFDASFDFFFGAAFGAGVFDGGLVFEIGLLELDDFVDALDFADWGVGATLKVVVWGRNDHDANGSIERNKNRELDDQSNHGTERLDVVAFIKIHHLKRFELTVAITVLLNLSELRLNFAHLAGLVKLTLQDRPEADFDKNSK